MAVAGLEEESEEAQVSLRNIPSKNDTHYPKASITLQGLQPSPPNTPPLTITTPQKKDIAIF